MNLNDQPASGAVPPGRVLPFPAGVTTATGGRSIAERCSLYQSAYDREGLGCYTPEEVIAAIKDGTHRAAVAWIRKCAANGDEDGKNEAKRKLPAVTWGGGFHARKITGLASYSGLVVVDIDGLDTHDDAAEIRDLFRDVALAGFISPSGTGTKLVFRHGSSDPLDHASAWASAVALVVGRCPDLASKVDASGKDVCRLCFLSYDPGAWIEANAKPITVTIQPRETEEPATRIEASGDAIAENRHQWLLTMAGRAVTLLGKDCHRDSLVDLLRTEWRRKVKGRDPQPHEVENAIDGALGKGFGASISSAAEEAEALEHGKRAAESLLAGDARRRSIEATPFSWRDPSLIPPRQWLYGRHMIRGFLSVLGSAGGLGKTQLTITEALAMVTGKDLLGEDSYGKKLRVWLWNLEDPRDELERRIAAAMLSNGIEPGELGDRLFVDSGRDNPLCIAQSGREGATILRPVVAALVAEIEARKIDVLIVDPFVSSHQVPENDNGQVDAVAKEWGRVAHLTGCGILLVHHVRKLGGVEATSESLRGAKALVDAARAVRILNPMSEDDAAKAGLPSRKGMFSITNDKSNLAPAPDKAAWYRLHDQPLPNGDHVGVVRPWEWPAHDDGVTVEIMDKVRVALLDTPGRESAQAKGWAGEAVARVMGLDLDSAADRHRIQRLIKQWIKDGLLRTITIYDDQRRPRPGITGASCSTCKSEVEQGGASGATPPRSTCSTPPPSSVGGGGGGAVVEQRLLHLRSTSMSDEPDPSEDLFDDGL